MLEDQCGPPPCCDSYDTSHFAYSRALRQNQASVRTVS